MSATQQVIAPHGMSAGHCFSAPLERIATAGFAAATMGIIVFAPDLAHYAFPATALVLGLLLYQRNPIRYVSFTLWLYFLSPLIRRIVDFRSSWLNPSPILLAPLLIALITLPFFLREINKNWMNKDIWPYAFALSAITAGLAWGFVANPQKKDALAAYLNWLAPICFGYYVLRSPLDRDRLKRAITRTFVFGVLLMGVYGTYQFVAAPAWDCYWLDQMNSGDISVSVMGRPEPYGLRIWSTMNSPGPFSTALTVGLLLIFVDHKKIRFPAAIAGCISLLLSLVRSGWLGLTAGVFAVFTSNKKHIPRVALTIVVGTFLILPAMLYQPIADAIQNRIQTFQSIGDDESANERAYGYAHLADVIVSSPLGSGLSNSDRYQGYVLDSTLLRLPLQLGWAGCCLYLAGLCLLVRRMFPLSKENRFGTVARGIVISVLVRAPFGQTLVSVDGLILWMFLGLTIAEVEQSRSSEVLQEE